MKKFKYLIISFLTIFFLNSCDLMDLKPLDKLSEEDVWNDSSLMQMYVNSCYNSLNHGYVAYMEGCYTDELWSRSNDAGPHDVLGGALDPDIVNKLPSFLNCWANGFAYIRKINIFLEKSNGAPLTDQQRNNMVGELKFLRAFIYANLIWSYGGVPIINKVYQLGGDYKVARSSYEECVNFIVSELDEAKKMLPAKRSENEAGHASGDACQALKARVLLYWASPLNNPANSIDRWENAANAAEELIDTRYSLYDDYEKIFIEENSEIIFERQFTESNALYFSGWQGRSGDGGQGGSVPTQNIVNSYEMKATGKLPYIEQSDGTYVQDQTSGYDPQHPYAGRDPRFYASVLYDGSMWMGRATETFNGGRDHKDYAGGGYTWLASETGYYLRKFVDETVPPTGSSAHPTNPWIYFRYAEILLNYAEAKFETGDETVAREYLNKVRNRKGVEMPEVTDIGDALRKRIQNERRVELAFEHHRFFDVRRWKIANKTENQPVTSMEIVKQSDNSKIYREEIRLQRNFQEKHYVLPIPRTEVEKSLGFIEQNSGY